MIIWMTFCVMCSVHPTRAIQFFPVNLIILLVSCMSKICSARLERLKKKEKCDVYFIPETTLLFDQLQAFRARREHFAVVVDEYGDFRGIVTLEDILEEIVGDIDDEHDIGLAGLSAQADGSWLVDGGVTIRDLNRTLGWHLPDEDASTLAGLILFESRTIPSPGQEFRFHEIRFRIVKREGNRLTSLRLWAS
uniref:Putative Mg2+ and Co2+ transporter CorB n=1 Tax=uncultured alpha proteobacterium EBAC2C11 TaxID=295349 RepID=Q5UF15_9PROT|nr:putative Mg2+ and Co2+ transporter CorB [uncultured alpha proteobacterium EBAC2C11]